MIADAAAAGTVEPDRHNIRIWADEGLIQPVQTRRGNLLVFTNDTGALTQSLRVYGEWAEEEISLLQCFISRDSTVIDVGAYIGTHTLAFSSFVGPAGKVYAFEAQPASFCLLRQNIEVNAVTNAVGFNRIVTASDDLSPVRLATINPGSQCSFGSTPVEVGDNDPGNASATCPPAVTAMCLDQLVLDSCALIKIDVEGMEDAVIAGAEAVICAHRPAIYAECNSVDAGTRVVRQLRGLGYSIWMHLAEPFNPGNWRSNSTNIFGVNKEAALLGIPQDRRPICASLQSRGVCLFEITTIDDLVAGMLLKPQYSREVLAQTTAVRRQS